MQAGINLEVLRKCANSTISVVRKDNIYIDMQAGRNLLPKLPVADN